MAGDATETADFLALEAVTAAATAGMPLWGVATAVTANGDAEVFLARTTVTPVEAAFIVAGGCTTGTMDVLALSDNEAADIGFVAVATASADATDFAGAGAAGTAGTTILPGPAGVASAATGAAAGAAAVSSGFGSPC